MEMEREREREISFPEHTRSIPHHWGREFRHNLTQAARCIYGLQVWAVCSQKWHLPRSSWPRAYKEVILQSRSGNQDLGSTSCSRRSQPPSRRHEAHGDWRQLIGA